MIDGRPPVTRAVAAAWIVATLSLVLTGCVEPVAAPPATRPLLPTLEPAVDLNPDPRIVEVQLEAVEAEFDYRGDGVVTRVMAYRDAGRPGSPATIPGPHIVTNAGDTLVVRFTNRMRERTTTVHWHGLRLPADMDGNPAHSGATYPGESFDYRFVVRDAGLHWYHPHVDTDQQMELGLYGTLLVRAPSEPEVDVERVLVLDDVDLDRDASVRLDPDAEDIALGRHGEVILVNGRERPSLVVQSGTTERIVAAGGTRIIADAWSAERDPILDRLDGLRVEHHDPGPQDPVAQINHPGDGEVRKVNVDIPFVGFADDPQDGKVPADKLIWTSDLEGQIGVGENFNAPLSMVGKHTITLTATDIDGNEGTASLVLNME